MTPNFIHIWLLVVLCGSLAVILGGIIGSPDENAMSKPKHYMCCLMNIMINLAVSAGVVFMFKIFVIWLLTKISNESYNNERYDWFYLMLSLLIPVFASFERIKFPGSNSVARATNYIYTEQYKSGGSKKIDNARKFRGPMFVILNFFNRFEGYIELESRDVLTAVINMLTFLDDVGSAVLKVTYHVTNVDKYASKGNTIKQRESNVRETVASKLKTLFEEITAKYNVRYVMLNYNKVFKDLLDEILKKVSKIEEDLGIEIDFLALTDINESSEHAAALKAQGALEAGRKQAREMVTDSGDKMPFETAMKLAAAYADKAQYVIIDGNGRGTKVMLDSSIIGGKKK